MSLFWEFSKDVLAATWSIPAKRLMGIVFRLSIVVGIIMGFVSLYQMYTKYSALVGYYARIHVALRCAQVHSDQVLLQHANQSNNIDISKVYCTHRTLWASLAEIRGEPATFDPSSKVNFWLYIDPLMAIWNGLGVMVGVNLLGVLLIGIRRIAAWVIGTEQV